MDTFLAGGDAGRHRIIKVPTFFSFFLTSSLTISAQYLAVNSRDHITFFRLPIRNPILFVIPNTDVLTRAAAMNGTTNRRCTNDVPVAISFVVFKLFKHASGRQGFNKMSRMHQLFVAILHLLFTISTAILTSRVVEDVAFPV